MKLIEKQAFKLMDYILSNLCLTYESEDIKDFVMLDLINFELD